MPAPHWTTPEQFDFLTAEDAKWTIVKAGTGTLKSFYAWTTRAFLERWPVTVDDKMLAAANGIATEAKEEAEAKVLKRIENWFSNTHRRAKQTPPVPNLLLDLSGKYTRKKPPLQKWQAFSALYYRPQDSPLREEVRGLFEQRQDLAAIGFLASFLPPGTDIGTIDRLTFLSATEEQEVQSYIEEQSLLATEHRDHPWFLDDDYEDKPLLAENRYIQQRIDELPRVAQRALEEIEKATGYKGFLLLGGLTPEDDGEINTHTYFTGVATPTGLLFVESWDDIGQCRDAFIEWLQISYTQEEKQRRKGHSTGSLRTTHPPTTDTLTLPTESTPSDEPATPNEPTPNKSMPDESTPNEPVPNGSTPNKSMPNESTPDGPTPNRSTPGEPTPGEPTPDEPTSNRPAPGEQTSDELAPGGELTPDKSTLDESTPGSVTDLSLALITPPLAMPTPPPVTPDTTTVIPPLTTPHASSIASATPEIKANLFKYNPSYPNFITTGVIQHLNTVNGGSRWVEMVRNYLQLESQYPSRPMGRLSLRTHPQEVVHWGHQCNSVPSIANIGQFHQNWIVWWGSCQPKWRSVATWPYSHENAEGMDWSRLNVTGPHGLFAIIMSASWWASSIDSDPCHAAFSIAVDDLHWVMENLIHLNSRSQEAESKLKSTPVNHFPGHGERDPGKRKIKPSSKACV